MKILLLAIIIFWSTVSNGQKRFKSDSTKIKTSGPAPAQIGQAFFLVGILDNWKLLFSAVTTPDDVTNNQRKQLAQWLNNVKALPIDSTKQKK